MIFPLLLSTLLMHPVHETFAELEWNAESKRLEVALRLDPLDEQWLAKRYAKSRPIDRWALEYLKTRLVVSPTPIKNLTTPVKNLKDASEREEPSSPPYSYRWIGRQDEQSHVWWYFEIIPTDSQKPQWIAHQVLFDRGENYTNRVLLLGVVPKRTLTLTIQRFTAPLDPAEDERRRPAPSNR